MKELKYYLHLYLGCKLVWGKIYGLLTINTLEIIRSEGAWHQVKPILRPLSDITEEEKRELLWDNDTQEILAWFQKDTAAMTSKEFLFLLSKHFDLFNLIEAGLAINKLTLNIK